MAPAASRRSRRCRTPDVPLCRSEQTEVAQVRVAAQLDLQAGVRVPGQVGRHDERSAAKEPERRRQHSAVSDGQQLTDPRSRPATSSRATGSGRCSSATKFARADLGTVDRRDRPSSCRSCAERAPVVLARRDTRAVTSRATARVSMRNLTEDSSTPEPRYAMYVATPLGSLGVVGTDNNPLNRDYDSAVTTESVGVRRYTVAVSILAAPTVTAGRHSARRFLERIHPTGEP